MRLLPLFLLMSMTLHAAVIEVQYGITYWWLGRIGTTHMRFESHGDRYRIEAEAYLEGIAALIGRHHRERHTSTGMIADNGDLIPHRYDVNKTLDDYQSLQQYYFEPRQRRILLSTEDAYKTTRKHFDLATLGFKQIDTVDRRRYMRVMPFYARNDLLTLYFNVRRHLDPLATDGTLQLRTVGARDGKVTIKTASEHNRFTVLLDQEIFKSKEGKLFVETDASHYVTRAVLKDVLLFGDLEVEREWIKQSPEAP